MTSVLIIPTQYFFRFTQKLFSLSNSYPFRFIPAQKIYLQTIIVIFAFPYHTVKTSKIKLRHEGLYTLTIPRFKPRSISATIEKLTRPIFGKRGFGQGSIITNWKNIVGDVLEKYTFPEKITYPRNQRNNGTLHLRINSPALALELQHIETQLLERINTYFGYRAIVCIKITQGAIPDTQTQPLKKRRTISIEESKTLKSNLDIVSDPDLRDALLALGKEVTISKESNFS